MPISQDVAECRGRWAGYKRAVRNGERAADDPAVIKAEQDLAIAVVAAEATKLAAKAAALVDTWPDLTPEQLGRIASVLNAADQGAA